MTEEWQEPILGVHLRQVLRTMQQDCEIKLTFDLFDYVIYPWQNVNLQQPKPYGLEQENYLSFDNLALISIDSKCNTSKESHSPEQEVSVLE